MNALRAALLGCVVLGACYRGPVPAPNPAAAGFDAIGSDPMAIEVADRIMTALGGRDRWDEVRVLGWVVDGQRRILWDKREGDVRIDYMGVQPTRTTTFNVHTKEGRAWLGGTPVNAAAAGPWVSAAVADWRRDACSLVLPYWLKEDGITLRYLGQETQPNVGVVDRLGVELKGQGLPPLPRYELIVSQRLGLVVGWKGFEQRDDPQPVFAQPWLDWKWYGGIQLSSNRGAPSLTELCVLTAPPPHMMDAPGA